MFSVQTKKFHYIIFAILLISVLSYTKSKDISFLLYAPEVPLSVVKLNASDLKSITSTAFDPNRSTQIFIHGWRSDATVMERYKNAYLALGHFNFIAVDWLKPAGTINYLLVKGRVKRVN